MDDNCALDTILAAETEPTKEVLFAVKVPMYVEFTNRPVEFATIPVLAKTETVPVVVTGPPVIPLPVLTCVTVPDPLTVDQ